MVGVVKDFHFEPLYQTVAPMVLHAMPDWVPSIILVRIRPHDVAGTVDLLRQTWEKVEQDRPFSFAFLNGEVDRQYRTEQQWHQIVTYASGFAILIACLGLFGLASLSVARRTKEIGIRKVLGASASGIVVLLSREFLILLLIANLFAWPVAYWTMTQWLNAFAYRISPKVSTFILSGLLTLTIALGTVSYQAWRAA